VTAPCFFIINPAAGHAGVEAPRLLARARALGIAFEYEWSRGGETATSFVRQALRAGATTIVAVGGDGTVNDVINGFFIDEELIKPDAALAIVPFGSSNDLTRALGIPASAAALDVLRNGRQIAVDVGRAEYLDLLGRPRVKYFMNNADVGIGARIALGAQRHKMLGGSLAFFAAALQAIVDPQPWQGTLALDDGAPEAVNAVTVVIALGPYTGGGMRIAPGAKLDDGMFDVVTIDALSSGELLANLPSIYTGAHLSHPAVHHARAQAIRIETGGAPRLEMDGEVAGAGSVAFRMLAGRIPMWVPRP